MRNDSSSNLQLQPASPATGGLALLLLPGLAIGALVSVALLRGDGAGRVNLFWLLLYFVVLPGVGLVFTLLFLRRDARGLAGLLVKLPWQPAGWSRLLLTLDDGQRRLWFFCSSQCLVLGMALGNILAFLLILLFRDVYFSWQSTLLDDEAAAALFRFFALPWGFWEGAQVDEQLVLCTRVTLQDAGFIGDINTNCHRQWWQYLLAAQLFYSLLPRGLLCLWSWQLLRRAVNNTPQGGVAATSDQASIAKVLAPLAYQLEGPFLLVHWDAVPTTVLAALQARIGAPEQMLHAGPLASAEQEAASLQPAGTRVILLKGWEPPMARLGDYLERLPATGWLLPLDWSEAGLVPLRGTYLEEWQRFCALHPGWQVLQPVGNA